MHAHTTLHLYTIPKTSNITNISYLHKYYQLQTCQRIYRKRIPVIEYNKALFIVAKQAKSSNDSCVQTYSSLFSIIHNISEVHTWAHLKIIILIDFIRI